MIKLECSQCGPLEFVVIDGYDFSERLLEGIKFKVFSDERVEYEKSNYTDGLNMAKWVKEAVECVKETDVVNCPKCGDEVVINEPSPPIAIVPLTSMGDLLDSLG